VQIRGPRPGDGAAIASLWRELWELHEDWGGYPGSKLDADYLHVAARIDREAHERDGDPVAGRHIHLVAWLDGELVGQVEGWLERYGVRALATCEVRSLVVHAKARGKQVGRSLLETLERVATSLAGPTFLAAEVLHKNPWASFYAKLGYRAFQQHLGFDASSLINGKFAKIKPRSPTTRVRAAVPEDALSLARFDVHFAQLRHARGDRRFDRARAIDATLLDAIRQHLAEHQPARPGASKGLAASSDNVSSKTHTKEAAPLTMELVLEDADRRPLGSASMMISTLEPPFQRRKRGVVGRVCLLPHLSEAEVASAAEALLLHTAPIFRHNGAPTFEVVDLSTQSDNLIEALHRLGGTSWSNVVGKSSPAELLSPPSPQPTHSRAVGFLPPGRDK
jgi:GNAT superfamily N-acetyltransferase